MPALNSNEKVKCGDCRNSYVRAYANRHQKRCARQEINYHIAKKHAQPSLKQSTVCPSCEQEFPTYYSLQQHRGKNTELSNENLVIR